MARKIEMPDSVLSYNAGYHRGLNTEYHAEPLPVMFREWAMTELTDEEPVYELFMAGFNDGVQSYAREELKHKWSKA